MKATKPPSAFADADYEYHEAIYNGRGRDFILLCDAGLELCDGDGPPSWTNATKENKNDQLIMAIPDQIIPFHIPRIMEAVAQMKPDEFSFDALDGVPGFSYIVRMWWD